MAGPKASLFNNLVSDGEVSATASAGHARRVLAAHVQKTMQARKLTKRQMAESLNIKDEAQLAALLDPESEDLLFDTFHLAVSNLGYTVKISLLGPLSI